jgi:cytochrome c biogenesis protein CcmG/thiol:disulfide interchange protein DsbE
VLAVAVPLIALLGVLATRPPATMKRVRSPLIGKAVPTLSGELLDGGTFELPAPPGTWVLVNFFATWCVPCRVEHPELVRFAARHEVVGDAEVVGVVFQDSAQAVRDFRLSEGGTWPMVLDPNGSVAVRFGVARVPESYLIAPSGTVVAKFTGGIKDDDLEQLLARLTSAQQ